MASIVAFACMEVKIKNLSHYILYSKSQIMKVGLTITYHIMYPNKKSIIKQNRPS